MQILIQNPEARYSCPCWCSWLTRDLQCPQRSVAGGIKGLCMLLKWMTYPCRYSDMIWVCWWNSSPHMQAKRKPESCLQRPQKSAFSQIPVCHLTKWTDCQHVRPCRYVTEPLKEVGFVCFERVRKKNVKTLIPNFEEEIKFLRGCYSCSNIFQIHVVVVLLFYF